MATTSKNNWEIKQIAIKDLTLWDENSRIPDYLLNSNEQELIQILLKKYDLESFAGEVIKDFDLPQIEKIIVWDNKGKLMVLEGNRRLATYKCLINPALINDEDLKTKFEALGGRISINEHFKLEAVVTADKDEGMRFIERKHYYGNNEKRWEQYERDHHIKRTRDASASDTLSQKERDSIFRANLGEKVKLVDLPDEIKQKALGRGFATTFYRVVGSTQGRKKLKYERLDYDLRIEDQKEFLSLLKVVIYNLVNKETLDGKKRLNSRTLNEDAEIKDYLDSISINDGKEVDKLIASQRAAQTTGPIKYGKQSALKQRKSKEEKYFSLISPRLSLPNKTPEKIKSVFKELQKINVSDCPTASSVLARIMIEITTDEFLKKKGDTSKQNDELVKKINHIKSTYVTDADLKKTIDLLNNDLLTKKLNQVVHNTIFQATETTIKDLWKNLSHFFDFLIIGIKSK